jgi:hypothetical protein
MSSRIAATRKASGPNGGRARIGGTHQRRTTGAAVRNTGATIRLQSEDGAAQLGKEKGHVYQTRKELAYEQLIGSTTDLKRSAQIRAEI